MKKLDIEPSKGYLLVEMFEKPTEIGGLVLGEVDQQNAAPVRGTVTRSNEAAGSVFKVGETIFFRKYAIDELKFLDENLVEQIVFLVDEREILGVVRPLKENKEEIDVIETRELSKEQDALLAEVSKK